MRIDSLSTPLKIAAASAVVLFVSLFFPWYGTDTEALGIDATTSAWQAFNLLDIIVVLIVAAVLALVLSEASGRSPQLPTTPLITGLGVLALVFIFYRFLNRPFDLDPRYGLFLGLAAAAGVAVGGWMAMRETGTSFAAARDEIGSHVDQARRDAADAIAGDSRRLEELSREELYEEAQRRDIPGRSEMSKEELIDALGRSR